jgi:hypothetical protein
VTYDILKQFIEKKGRYPRRCKNKSESKLGNWVHAQKAYYKNGELSSDKIHLCESLPGWQWKKDHDAIWMKNYIRYKNFVEQNKRHPVQSEKVRKTLEWELGGWKIKQRWLYVRNLLSPDKIQLMGMLEGWEWSPNEIKTAPPRKQLAKDVKSLSQKEILSKYHVSVGTLKRWMEEYGLEFPLPKSIKNKPSLSELKKCLKDGLTWTQIGDKFGVSAAQAIKWGKHHELYVPEKRINITKSEMQECINEGLNWEEMGRKYKCTAEGIVRIAKQYELWRRKERKKPPSKKELQNLIKQNLSWKNIGKHFGIDANAARRWSKKYGFKKQKTPRCNFRPFKDARSFIHSLGLTSWRSYIATGRKPIDIPCNPQFVYKNKGWVDMWDWLGIKRKYKNRKLIREEKRQKYSQK